MGSNKHDPALMGILKEDKSVVSFLDSIFGFLYRCTDFYHLQDENTKKIGFPQGVAKEVLQHMYQRYENQHRYEAEAAVLENLATSNISIPAACQEVELTSDNSKTEDITSAIPCISTKKANELKNYNEFYNGDDRGTYRWSQTIGDIDLLILVPENIKKADKLKVKIEPFSLKINYFSEEEWVLLLEQTFIHKVTVDESLWSLIPGEHIHVNLEKREARWWDRLFLTDPPINVKKIDTTVSASDLSQEEHMKMEELVVSQEKRQLLASSGLGRSTIEPKIERSTIESALNRKDFPFQGNPTN